MMFSCSYAKEKQTRHLGKEEKGYYQNCMVFKKKDTKTNKISQQKGGKTKGEVF